MELGKKKVMYWMFLGSRPVLSDQFCSCFVCKNVTNHGTSRVPAGTDEAEHMEFQDKMREGKGRVMKDIDDLEFWDPHATTIVNFHRQAFMD
ncbi:hypothetical protein SLE2022_016680 [Rubroshorea leprosula]